MCYIQAMSLDWLYCCYLFILMWYIDLKLIAHYLVFAQLVVAETASCDIKHLCRIPMQSALWQAAIVDVDVVVTSADPQAVMSQFMQLTLC